MACYRNFICVTLVVAGVFFTSQSCFHQIHLLKSFVVLQETLLEVVWSWTLKRSRWRCWIASSSLSIWESLRWAGRLCRRYWRLLSAWNWMTWPFCVNMYSKHYVEVSLMRGQRNLCYQRWVYRVRLKDKYTAQLSNPLLSEYSIISSQTHSTNSL